MRRVRAADANANANAADGGEPEAPGVWLDIGERKGIG